MIFLISVVLPLVRAFFLFCVSFLSFVFHFGAKGCRRMIFQRVHLCIWAIGGHELGTFSIEYPIHWQFMSVHDNSWALKFDNFSEFQKVVSNSTSPLPTLSVIMTPYVWKSICDSPLNNLFLFCRYFIF